MASATYSVFCQSQDGMWQRVRRRLEKQAAIDYAKWLLTQSYVKDVAIYSGDNFGGDKINLLTGGSLGSSSSGNTISNGK